MAKKLSEKKILEIVEAIEQYIADNLTDDDKYEVPADKVLSVAGASAEEINYDMICIYAMHEVITVERNDGPIKYDLFADMQYADEKFITTINNEIRQYFEMLKTENE